MNELEKLLEAVRYYLDFEEAHGIGGDVQGHEPEYVRLMEVIEKMDPLGKKSKISTDPTHCHCGEKLIFWREKESGECVHHIEESHLIDQV